MGLLNDVLGHRDHLLLLQLLLLKLLLNMVRIKHHLHAPPVQADLLCPLNQIELRLGDTESDTVLLVLQVVQLGLLLHPRRCEALLLLLKPC